MLERLLRWIADRRPARFIGVNGEPYMERYWLFSLFGWRVYLHRFMDSDANHEGLHNHVFRRAVSLILTEGYNEERYVSFGPSGCVQITRTLPRFALNFIGPNDFHRVVLNTNPDGTRRPTWTLFALSKNEAPHWGFLKRAGPIVADPDPASFDHTPPGAPVTLEFTPMKASPQDWYRNAPKGRTLSW